MKELFYAIYMQTKNNKTLYLKEGSNNNFEWTFDFQECLWFETKDSTEKFAKEYFKNFKDWKIKEFIYYI